MNISLRGGIKDQDKNSGSPSISEKDETANISCWREYKYHPGWGAVIWTLVAGNKESSEREKLWVEVAFLLFSKMFLGKRR